MINFSAVTRTRGSTAIPVEDCYINYHEPSTHNKGLGSIGGTWCVNCRGNDNNGKKDTTNTIHPRAWGEARRTQLTNKLRQLVGDNPRTTSE